MAWFLDQLVNALLQLTVALVIFMANQLVQPLGLTPDVIVTYFKGVDTFTESFKVLALFILFIIVLFSLTKNIFGHASYGEKDNSAVLVIRAGIAAALIMWSMSVMSYCFNAFSQPFYVLNDDTGEYKTFDVVNDEENVFRNSISESLSLFLESAEKINEEEYDSVLDRIQDWIFPGKAILSGIIKLIAIAILGYKLILFLLEILERYLLLMLQAFTSPLIWTTIASRSTIGIFKKWLEMFISNFILMYLNMWMLGLIVRSMSTVFNPDTSLALNANFKPNIILGACLIYAMIRIAQSLDTHLGKLLSTATTGTGLGQEIFMTMRSVQESIRSVLRVGGKAVSSISGGESSSYQKVENFKEDSKKTEDAKTDGGERFTEHYKSSKDFRNKEDHGFDPMDVSSGPDTPILDGPGGAENTALNSENNNLTSKESLSDIQSKENLNTSKVYTIGDTKEQTGSSESKNLERFNAFSKENEPNSFKTGEDALKETSTALTASELFGKELAESKGHRLNFSPGENNKASGTLYAPSYPEAVSFSEINGKEKIPEGSIAAVGENGKLYALSSSDNNYSARQAALDMMHLDNAMDLKTFAERTGIDRESLVSALSDSGCIPQEVYRNSDGTLNVYGTNEANGDEQYIAALKPLASGEEQESLENNNTVLYGENGQAYEVDFAPVSSISEMNSSYDLPEFTYDVDEIGDPALAGRDDLPFDKDFSPKEKESIGNISTIGDNPNTSLFEDAAAFKRMEELNSRIESPVETLKSLGERDTAKDSSRFINSSLYEKEENFKDAAGVLPSKAESIQPERYGELKGVSKERPISSPELLIGAPTERALDFNAIKPKDKIPVSAKEGREGERLKTLSFYPPLSEEKQDIYSRDFLDESHALGKEIPEFDPKDMETYPGKKFDNEIKTIGTRPLEENKKSIKQAGKKEDGSSQSKEIKEEGKPLKGENELSLKNKASISEEKALGLKSPPIEIDIPESKKEEAVNPMERDKQLKSLKENPWES